MGNTFLKISHLYLSSEVRKIVMGIVDIDKFCPYLERIKAYSDSVLREFTCVVLGALYVVREIWIRQGIICKI